MRSKKGGKGKETEVSFTRIWAKGVCTMAVPKASPLRPLRGGGLQIAFFLAEAYSFARLSWDFGGKNGGKRTDQSEKAGCACQVPSSSL